MTDIPQIISAASPLGAAGAVPIRSTWKRLYQFIRSRVSTHEDAEDLMQDVAYKLLETYDAGDSIERLSAWLFAVARNKITDWYRKRHETSSLGIEGDDSTSPHQNDISVIHDPSGDAATETERKEFWSVFTEALDALPASQRDVFIKHELDGMSFKEIAEESGEPISALLSRKHYAVVKLRAMLADYHAND